MFGPFYDSQPTTHTPGVLAHRCMGMGWPWALAGLPVHIPRFKVWPSVLDQISASLAQKFLNISLTETKGSPCNITEWVTKHYPFVGHVYNN